MENIILNDEEKALVANYENAIDLSDSTSIITYGSDAQKKISEFSDTALNGVKTKDLGDVSSSISSLVADIKGFKVEPEKKGLKALFQKKGAYLVELKARYDTVENNVNKVVVKLEGHQDQLTKDIVMLDEMYKANMEYFKDLNMYIIAGKEKLEQERATTLVELENKAKESGLTEDAQKASDFANLCMRFEKRLSDLEITKTISVQMAPQIRLIQNSDNLMVEKIQTTLNNTIPLWKNQMVLALGVAHSAMAVEAEKAVTDATNELLIKNAEKLHQGAVAVATESERAIVDMETLTKTNEELITTLDDVLKIQKEGHQKRIEAAAQLQDIEDKLKAKLLEVVDAGVEK